MHIAHITTCVHWLVVRQQPMRTPAQASVNVIMHEDVRKMSEAAKYAGIEDQIQRLQNGIAAR